MRFITDIGKSKTIRFVCEDDGRQMTEKIDRYAVWDTDNDQKPGRPQVVAHGNDLDELQREWGPGLRVLDPKNLTVAPKESWQ